MNTVLQYREISIQGLQISAKMGVCDLERSEPQSLLVDLKFILGLQAENLHDDISQTVDYKAVADRVVDIAGERPRHLVETLVDDVAQTLIAEFGLASIEVTVRKFILPNAEHVSVTVRRLRAES